MEKPKLKIHQFYQDYVYWTKICALCETPTQRDSLYGIRHKGYLPKTKNQKNLVVEFHKIINEDDRKYEQVLVDLLSPVEESISG